MKVFILGTRSHGWAASAQGWFTRVRGEPRPQWSHVAFLFRNFTDEDAAAFAAWTTENGLPQLAAQGRDGLAEFIIESVGSGTRLIVDWRKVYDNKKHWWVACEMADLSEAEARVMVSRAIVYLGRKYDWWAIAKHAIDGQLGHLVGHDVFLARRIKLRFWNRDDRYNICAWLVAFVADRAAQWHFVEKNGNPLLPQFVAPNDIEANVFFLRPGLYLCPADGGRRPSDLDPRALAKLKKDHSSALDCEPDSWENEDVGGGLSR